ncbi:putative Mediator of RNA polymerase II transcription subunit 21 [Hypsibius exemplaris]|uniref:Mediator of RNA polymerase II transcription subunit 21 n=1 Tax=Hypsibius exemplaris TaxID=2072580 RepID=A0A1W0X3V2_HYPEX|nr:putative Mediator of RNA polymerase II transcription subunit 21 [Hypsibius exemplaris]
MCDRITQVQDQVNQLADHMCNAVGILQQQVHPSILPGHDQLFSTVVKNENSDFKPKDLPPLFATLITRAVKELDVMIDRLPNDDQTLEPDVAYIEKLNQVNREAARIFTSTTEASQHLLEKIQTSLKEISECEMDIDRRHAGAKS